MQSHRFCLDRQLYLEEVATLSPSVVGALWSSRRAFPVDWTQVCAIGGDIVTQIQRRHDGCHEGDRAQDDLAKSASRVTPFGGICPTDCGWPQLTHGLSLYREGVSSASNSVEPEPQQHVASGSGVVSSACHTNGSPDAIVRSSEHLRSADPARSVSGS